MTNGKELLKELQCLVSDGAHIDEEAYRRLSLTAMIGVLTRLDGLNENPMIYLGDIMKKHPKVVLFIVLLGVLLFAFIDVRTAVYAFLGLPPIPTIVP